MGNTSNHTPAPWACFNDHPNPDTAESLTHIRAVAAGSEPRWMRKDIADIYGCTNPEQLANANLIAAAPEMLELLEHLHNRATITEAIRIAAVIDKAKGGANE